MFLSRFVRQSVWMLCLSLIAAGVFAQAAACAEFEPKVGQAGKDVIWVPTGQDLVSKMLDMAKVTPQDYVIDLGSGDGRTVITAAKRGARALGIEYNPDMVDLSKRNAAREGVSDKTQFVKADLFQSDFSQATVLTMFLMPDINLKLRPQILDMKPGTRVVSNTFTMDDWVPDETYTMEDTTECGFYCTALFWVVPAKVEGTWQLSQGELALKQSFQKFSGTLKFGPSSKAVLDGKINGDMITFSVGDAKYTGRVSGNTMQGTFIPGQSAAPWSASRAK
jgi:SAM-dependent methyltransferase